MKSDNAALMAYAAAIANALWQVTYRKYSHPRSYQIENIVNHPHQQTFEETRQGL